MGCRKEEQRRAGERPSGASILARGASPRTALPHSSIVDSGRSKTNLTAEILRDARQLLAIGCFCIGTNQVDLEAAARQGVSVVMTRIESRRRWRKDTSEGNS